MTGIMDYEKPNSSVNTFKGTMRDIEVRGSKSIEVAVRCRSATSSRIRFA